MTGPAPAPAPARAARQGVGGLGLVGFGLLVALLAVALAQARQFSLLRQALQAPDEYAVMAVHAAESDYLRLRELWLAAADGRQPLDAQALGQQYRRWLDRLQPLRARPAPALIDADPGFTATVAELEGFIAAADRALGPRPEGEPSPAFVAALQPALVALGEPLQRLSDGAAQRLAGQVERRTQAVRQQNLLGIGLTVFLTLLTLAFAAIALRQVRQLRERRMALEELTTRLRQARGEAEAASQAKSAFLANMSHEIRTPFHGLMGMLSLLRETGLTARQSGYVRTATESADHLLAILNDILDMSQLESGRLALVSAPLDLRTLLRDVEALMRPQANAKSLALHLDTDPGVPERVLADATRVKQILFNLLSNAIKFSDRGAVVLDVRRRSPGDDTGPAIEFVVSDTGVGMDEATLARLFNRFVQGDSSRSRRHGGTGLGLEISRNLARLMGGDITVRSRLGQGSVFSFHMPLRTPADVAPAAASVLAEAAAAAPARPLHVLVAEDHPVNREYMAALLESMGHEAHFTTNGREAVQAAEARRYDLVLMDLHMPVLDGVGATRAIRALPDPGRSTVPIVAMTADAFDETRERCLVAGMNDFLTKPVSPDKLATSLRRLFGTATEPGSDAAGGRPAEAAPSVPPPRPGEPPLLDEAAIAMALGAMPRQKLAALIQAFLDQGPQTVQHLRSAVRDAQPLDLRVHAHAAKGAALNLGLTALAGTAEALQQGAAHLPAHEVARLVQRYEDLLVATRAAAAASGLGGAGALLSS